MSNKYYIKKIAMDMYRAKILKPALEEAGFTVEIVRSGSVTHGMLKDLVDDLQYQRIIASSPKYKR